MENVPTDPELEEIVSRIMAKKGEQTGSDTQRTIKKAEAAAQEVIEELKRMSMEGKLTNQTSEIIRLICSRLEDKFRMFSHEELFTIVVFLNSNFVMRGLRI